MMIELDILNTHASMDIIEFNPKYPVTDNITLGDFLNVGYGHFHKRQNGIVAPEVIDTSKLTQTTLIYRNGSIIGTLTLQYPNGVTGVDRFFQTTSGEPIENLVRAQTGLDSRAVTISKLTIAELNGKNVEDLKIQLDIEAFRSLAHTAAEQVQCTYNEDANGVMIARPGLIKIMNRMGLRFTPLEGISMRSDPEFEDFKAYYDHYWLKLPYPTVYITKASTILEATGVERKSDLTSRILSPLLRKVATLLG